MITVGSYVTVPATPDNISTFNNQGYVTSIIEPYCKVLIRYGKRMKGTWEGPIKDITELESPTKERT